MAALTSSFSSSVEGSFSGVSGFLLVMAMAARRQARWRGGRQRVAVLAKRQRPGKGAGKSEDKKKGTQGTQCSWYALHALASSPHART